MGKIWLIATSTYRRRVRSGSFLFLTLGLPILMVVAGALPLLLQGGTDIPERVGYVDQTGLLTPVSQVTVEETTVALMFYAEPAAARDAFERGEIGGYLVIPQGYLAGAMPTFYGEDESGEWLESALAVFMRRGFFGRRPCSVVRRCRPADCGLH